MTRSKEHSASNLVLTADRPMFGANEVRRTILILIWLLCWALPSLADEFKWNHSPQSTCASSPGSKTSGKNTSADGFNKATYLRTALALPVNPYSSFSLSYILRAVCLCFLGALRYS